MTLQEILEIYPDEEILKADGFDRAVIGIDPESMRLVYDRNIMFDILVTDEEMDPTDAIEHLDFNVYGAYVGEKTPIYVLI
jgi:uncharacterized Rossmann fold enzyme